MTVHRFQRPELDEQIITALEQVDLSEKALAFFAQQRAAIRHVREGLGRTVRPSLLEMLDGELASFDMEVELAESMVSDWKEILAVLQSRAAKP